VSRRPGGPVASRRAAGGRAVAVRHAAASVRRGGYQAQGKAWPEKRLKKEKKRKKK
jgi:hypothetical protein